MPGWAAVCARLGGGTRQAGRAVRAAGAVAARKKILEITIFTSSKNKFIQSKSSSVPTHCRILIFLKINLYLSQPNLNDLFMRGKYITIVGKHRSSWNEIHYLIMRNNNIVMKSRYRRD